MTAEQCEVPDNRVTVEMRRQDIMQRMMTELQARKQSGRSSRQNQEASIHEEQASAVGLDRLTMHYRAQVERED